RRARRAPRDGPRPATRRAPRVIARRPRGRAPRRKGSAPAAVATALAMALSLAASLAPRSSAGPGARAAAAEPPGRAAAPAPWTGSPAPAGLGVPSIPVTLVDGVPVVGANDLARLLGASRTWRDDVRKLGIKLGEHRLTFTDENPFVIADDRMLRLAHPVRAHGGELQIPVELAPSLP